MTTLPELNNPRLAGRLHFVQDLQSADRKAHGSRERCSKMPLCDPLPYIMQS